MLSIAKSNQELVGNTHSKTQESLEFKMYKQSDCFSFYIPPQLNEKRMMGVRSFEVYITVYNSIRKNNELEELLTEQQLEEQRIDSQLVTNI